MVDALLDARGNWSRACERGFQSETFILVVKQFWLVLSIVLS